MTGDTSSPKLLAPGSTVGMIGGGQLGRMFAIAARRCGYRVHLFGDAEDSPAGQVSDRVWDCALTDHDAAREFAESVDVVSYEFENLPVATVAAIDAVTAVFPGPALLEVAQHRALEKSTLQQIGIPTAAFHRITSLHELASAAELLGGCGILKTATLGYDGKGQVRIRSIQECATAWESVGGSESILEQEIDFEFEMSIVAARFAGGHIAIYEPVVNDHVNHILDLSVSPSPRITAAMAQDAKDIAAAILKHFNVYGVLCVEFFVTRAGSVLVNEIAPRPHNSGHLTIDACSSSQFEQQLRAICGLPSGRIRQRQPAAMANLLGDHIGRTTPRQWAAVFGCPDVQVHLYGKSESRIGRKMGHLTCVADTADEAIRAVLSARQILRNDR